VPTLGHIASVELPVLGGVFNAFDEALLLLVLGDIEHDLYYTNAVAVGIGLEGGDVLVAGVKQVTHVLLLLVGQTLILLDNLGVHFADEHLLVVRAIENADATARRKLQHGGPEVVVIQLTLTGALEIMHLHAVGVDPTHDVFDGSVFARGVVSAAMQVTPEVIHGLSWIAFGLSALSLWGFLHSLKASAN
jgi:hypothetical protein